MKILGVIAAVIATVVIYEKVRSHRLRKYAESLAKKRPQ